MVLADRLAWVAQPTELAPEVSPRFKSTTLLDRVRTHVPIFYSLLTLVLGEENRPLVAFTGRGEAISRTAPLGIVRWRDVLLAQVAM